jgi:hypothetical protein
VDAIPIVAREGFRPRASGVGLRIRSGIRSLKPEVRGPKPSLRRPRRLVHVGGSFASLQWCSAINLNRHFHVIVPDGVFTPDADAEGEVRLHAIGGPSDAEVIAILERVVRRVHRHLERLGDAEDTADEDALPTLQAEAVQARLPGHDAPTPAASDAPKKRGAVLQGRQCAFQDGFSLHAGVHLHAHDRAGLERLLRYASRPAVALARLELLADGRVCYRPKRVRPGGPPELVLTPDELLGRLCSIVPPPRRHLVRYIGVFAAHSGLRPFLVPRLGPETAPPDRPRRHPCAPSPAGQPPPPPPGPIGYGLLAGSPRPETLGAAFERRLPWAQLLKRTYSTDVLTCARCKGPMTLIAYISATDVVTKILDHLGLPSSPPPLTKILDHLGLPSSPPPLARPPPSLFDQEPPDDPPEVTAPLPEDDLADPVWPD